MSCARQFLEQAGTREDGHFFKGLAEGAGRRDSGIMGHEKKEIGVGAVGGESFWIIRIIHLCWIWEYIFSFQWK